MDAAAVACIFESLKMVLPRKMVAAAVTLCSQQMARGSLSLLLSMLASPPANLLEPTYRLSTL